MCTVLGPSRRQHDGSSSPTSTIIYRHVPYEEHSKYVIRAIAHLFPDALEPISTVRMHGGTSNRVIGVNVQDREGQKQFVYRTPRGSAPTEETAALLHYLQSRVTLPTPTVISSESEPISLAANGSQHNSAEHEPGGEAFILMERLKGTPLSEVYHTFSHRQKIDFASQVAAVMLDIFGIPVPAKVGTLAVSTDNDLLVRPFIENQIIWPSGGREEEAKPTKEDLPDRLDAASYFFKLFSYMQRAKRTEHPPNIYEERCYRKLVAAVRLLLPSEQNQADPASVVFTHPDLSARNVLVMPPQVEGEAWTITGVVDWDECLAVPPLAAFWSPSWLWNGLPDQTTDTVPDYKEWEYDINPEDEPCSEESLEIRKAFIQTIETRYPGYMEIVQLGHRARIKQMLYIAQNGCYDSGVEYILDDIYQSAGLPTLFGSVESLAQYADPAQDR